MKIQPVACPRCGASELRFVETATIWRRVAGVDDTHKIHINGFHTTDDESATDPRLHCISCLHEWPVPLDRCEFY